MQPLVKGEYKFTQAEDPNAFHVYDKDANVDSDHPLCTVTKQELTQLGLEPIALNDFSEHDGLLGNRATNGAKNFTLVAIGISTAVSATGTATGGAAYGTAVLANCSFAGSLASGLIYTPWVANPVATFVGLVAFVTVYKCWPTAPANTEQRF